MLMTAGFLTRADVTPPRVVPRDQELNLDYVPLQVNRHSSDPSSSRASLFAGGTLAAPRGEGKAGFRPLNR